MIKTFAAGFYVSLIRLIVFSLWFLGLNLNSAAQCKTSLQFYDELTEIENNSNLTANEGLKKVTALQRQFERCGLSKDSVYARLLHRSGAFYFSAGKLNEAIDYTLQSVNINVSGKKGSNPVFAVRSYSNLAAYHLYLHRYPEALRYYDSCIVQGNKYYRSSLSVYIADAIFRRGSIFFENGDYQNAIEEFTLGLKASGLPNSRDALVRLLNDRAQAYAALKLFNEAVKDVNKASFLINRNDYHALANNCKVRAQISEKDDDFTQAVSYYKKSIAFRAKTFDTALLAGDYLDAGDALRKKASKNNENYKNAAIYNAKAFLLSKKASNHFIAAKASNNLGLISLITHNYSVALAQYQDGLLETVQAFKSDNALDNPTHTICSAISDKNFLALLLGNKTECLLYLYKQSRNKQYLSSALKTALLTDSLITDMRHEQTGEQSKLYWRNETREFFTNAIEACYQAADGKLAFYFMEKSRAVLLNDKLNELGASAYLPPQEAQKEQSMQINVLSQQQQLSELAQADSMYDGQQVKLIQAKEDFDNYIKKLREKYPAYWQYKYADDVPNLAVMQKYLKANKQSFVHYFINDTIIYILGVTPSSSKFIKTNIKHFSSELLDFLKVCSNKQALNNHFNDFTRRSHHIYNVLFKPLQLPAGRVIICYDNLLVPFEALIADGGGRDFLIKNYRFSYVYSARFLLKNFNNPRGQGSFLGVAPVSYAGYLHVPKLMQSETSLHHSTAYFNESKLITNDDADRRNFLKLLPRYTIVTVLSHARADSSDEEPMLFMADSVIRLSELQLLRNPSTKLIVLSACQTNVGKIATGEGIISLARGFASAGIPCISATLWKADEKAIYAITENFLENISGGMRKDDALQKAKLEYIQNGSNESLLPFFWANMILAGNGDPIHPPGSNHIVVWLTFTIIILLLFFCLLRKKTGKHLNCYK